MTPRQEAMFNAVVDQHGRNIPSDIFPFSWDTLVFEDKNAPTFSPFRLIS